MDNSKTPLPEEMDRIDANNNQQVDLDNPMLHTIDNDDVIDDSVGFDNSQAGSGATQGLTPMHRQNIDEARVDEVLVEDNLDDSDYPNIVDIADRDAAENSNNDDL
ncbi:hypothetical protein [Psychrobacter sp. CAL346-MNA-CIBAN-0220]|uniref:hypothetical protein n=1 Tax=Psychrobacter sp. CAL346-MNA-CIBAN-0220 TaxID=3140457 RepID=UPI003324C86B